jgi:hypothetical protein
MIVLISGSLVTDLSLGEKNSALEQLNASSMFLQADCICDLAYHLYRLLDCNQLKSLDAIQHCVALNFLNIRSASFVVCLYLSKIMFSPRLC